MHIPEEKIQELALKWLKGETTPDEEKLLFEWYNSNNDTVTVVEDSEEELKERMLRNLSEQSGIPFFIHQKSPVRPIRWYRLAVASLLFVCLSAAAWFIYHADSHQNPELASTSVEVNNDLNPGSDKAILIMADGKELVLDDSANGTIGEEAKMSIVKDKGKISYVGEGAAEALVYNTIITPRKGQYHLVLSDGTGVWLDAESSIRFPVAFTTNTRDVEISGQVYFEVKSNPQKPFQVNIPLNNMKVNVLGTRFNIMAYSNELNVKTTLLDGAVKIATTNAAALLEPGQQASVNNSIQVDKKINVQAADLEQVMAWKNGMFNLGSTSIKEIMRQVARWYDAEITYEGNIENLRFSGEISRKKNVSELLQILEATGTVQFKVDGAKITVISKK